VKKITPSSRPRQSAALLAVAALCTSVLLAACTGATPPERATVGAERVQLGVDVLLAEHVASLAGARLGLITNHTGRTGADRSTIDALHGHPELQLVALFSPEHGIRGTAEAGERVASGIDEQTGLPVFWLYGETREPNAEMLEGVDVLLFDIQDVGSRYYTYVWTMTLAMRAAARHDRRILVLDRPNPIGGALVHGNVLDTAYATFVGLYPVPMRHGMTVGEIARYVNEEFNVGARLEVIPMRGWTRAMHFENTGLAWRAPSPNMPSVESALHYPGTCLFEGVNISVGRGTDRAFQQVGAPWLDSDAIVARLEARRLPGVRFEVVRFTPASPGDGKFDGVEVAGIRLTATDRASYDPTVTAIALLADIQALHGDSVRYFQSHFDRLAGTSAVRLGLLAGEDERTITAGWAAQRDAFEAIRRRYLLYP
jgi:uncharacterized protein YbbC (DUF1343 family)